jgi:hypothetical protein
MLDKMADIQHEIWSHWMRYLFTNGKMNNDGSFTIEKEKVERWKRQMDTSYNDLSDVEKKSDRQIVIDFIIKKLKFFDKMNFKDTDNDITEIINNNFSDLLEDQKEKKIKKYIVITFSNGDVFRILAEIIARKRAEYLIDEVDIPIGDIEIENRDEEVEKEIEISLKDPFELKEWFVGNIDWDEIKDKIEKIGHSNEYKYNYEDNFFDAEVELKGMPE